MTYPIDPGPFFRAAPNWGKPATLSLSLAQKLSNWTDVLLSALLIAAASRIHEESHLIYGPLESSVLDQGFPVEYELDEFNTPHTGITLSRLQLWLCRLRRKISLRHPATSSLGHIFWRHSRFSSQTTRTTHSFANLTMHISFRHLAAKIPSQLHNYFLPSFWRDLQHKRKPFSTLPLKPIIKTLQHLRFLSHLFTLKLSEETT